MHDIRLWDYLDDNQGMRQFPRMFKAEKGYMADGFLVLENVSFYEIDSDFGRTLVEARMPEVRIDIATQLAGQELRPDATELQALELRARISRDRDRIKSMSYMDPTIINSLNKDLVGYYFKYSIPLACLAFVLVAVPVSLRGPRDERNLGIILTFALVMVYYIIFFTCREVGSRGLIIPDNLQFMGMTIAKKGTNLFPPHIAGWLPPLVFFIASIPLIARARR
jgi:lipopolysaccharide export LptBFGC system permease protein LptF